MLLAMFLQLRFSQRRIRPQHHDSLEAAWIQIGCGTPITAASSTAGCLLIQRSTSAP